MSVKLGASSLENLALLIAATSAHVGRRPLVVGISASETATTHEELDKFSGKQGTSYMQFYLASFRN